jgi:hypothetical protein
MAALVHVLVVAGTFLPLAAMLAALAAAVWIRDAERERERARAAHSRKR